MKHWNWLIILFVVVGCTEKGETLRPHEPATEPAQSSTDEQSLDAEPIVASAALDFFSEANLRRPGFGHSLTERQKLTEFNLQAMAEPARFASIYENALKVDCEKAIDTCPGLRFFAQVPTSSRALAAIGRAEQDVRRYYWFLFHAFRVKNQQIDPWLATLIVLRSEEYLQSRLDAQEAEQFRSILSAVILGLPRTPNFQWPEKVDAWKLAMNEKLQLSVAVRSTLSELSLRKHREFARSLMTSAKKDSVVTIEKSLHQSDWKSLGFEPIKDPSLFYVFLDLVSTRQMEPEWASATLQGLSLDKELVQRELKSFIRTHFLSGVQEATAIAKANMFNPEMPADKLYHQAVKASSQVRQVWSTLKDRLALVQTFALRASREAGFPESVIRDLRSQFGGLDQSIRVTVLYPHLMILFHTLGEKRYVFQPPRSLKTYDASDFMLFLYNGEFPSEVLDYVDERLPATPTELFYSFDLALRTGVFKAAGVDVDVFISKSLQRFSELALKDIENRMDLVKKRIYGSQHYSEVKDICREFETGQKTQRTVDWDYLFSSPYYGRLKNRLLNPVNMSGTTKETSDGAVEALVENFNFLDTSEAEAMERWRIDLEAILRMGGAMMTAYRASLPSGQRNGAGAKTEQVLQQVRDLKQKTMIQFMSNWQKFGPCYPNVVKRDLEIQSMLIRYEREYLQQVARDVERLRELRNDPVGYRGLVQRYNHKQWFAGFVGLDRISEQGYTIYRPDFYMRLADYMKNGLVTDTVRLPPIAPHIRVNFGDQIKSDNKLVKDAEPEFLPMNSSQEFVSSAFRLYYNGARTIQGEYFKFIEWAYGLEVDIWEDRIVNLVTLYRGMFGQAGAPMSAQELVLEQENMMELSHISPEERQVYLEVNRPWKYEPLSFKDLIMTYRYTSDRVVEMWGLYDMPLRLAKEDLLGNSFYNSRAMADPDNGDGRIKAALHSLMPKRQGLLKLATDHFRIRSKGYRRNLWIRMNPVLDSYLDSKVLAFYRQERGAFNELAEAIGQREQHFLKLPQTQRPFVDFETDTQVTGPFLSPRIEHEFDLHWRQFNISTGNCFERGLKCEEIE